MEAAVKEGRRIRSLRVEDIVKRIQDSSSVVVTDYRGLNVAQISEIRRTLAPLGATLHVEKNKLVKIALDKATYPEEFKSYFVGPTAIAYVNEDGDVSAILKVLFKFDKQDAFKFSVKAAYVDGMVLPATEAKAVSNLPTRDQLVSMLMGTMNAPVRNLAVGLNDIIARAARVLQAVADTKK